MTGWYDLVSFRTDCPNWILGAECVQCVFICEWRISHLVTDEYYCENVAGMMRGALHRVAENAAALKERDEAAVRATAEGLVISGIASSYAGFSHMWEMMCLEQGRPIELHGIQVGIGTLIALKLYDWIRIFRPDREKALSGKNETEGKQKHVRTGN